MWRLVIALLGCFCLVFMTIIELSVSKMTQRFCCFVKLEKGCFLLGVSTFILGSLMTVGAITYMTLENQRKEPSSLTTNMTKAQRHVLNWSMDRPVIHVILGAVLLMGVLWMVFSVAFIYGVRKNKPACVVSYFLFGTAISIMFLLSAVLALLNKNWLFALCACAFTLAYMRCLVSVYSAYDLLQQGKTLGDVEQLITDEDFRIDDD